MVEACVKGTGWLAAVAVALLLGGSAPSFAQSPQIISVRTDHAQILKMPPKTTTVVIGNPMIADVTVQKNGSMVVTGKSYGTTNLIVQDAAGVVLGESIIQVEAPTDGIVLVQRGLERESYSCTPRCQPTLSLGDVQRHFEGVTGQTSSRNGLAK